MNHAKITTKGQITIPLEIRKKLGVKEGDKVVFIERDDMIVVANSNRLAFGEIQKEMEGEAEKAGLYTEEDVVKLCNEVRQEIWEKKHASND